MKGYIIVSEKDNVATALRDIKKNEVLAGISIQEELKSGHKFALKDIEEGEKIIKYAEPIALASKAIKAGQWVHIHNTAGIRGRGDKE
ncbi:UxaA family hydrolase [Campylobacter sp. VTCC 70190]|uniref:UxaA family hydrolase n=1 Tax=Campylobacter sp. VTCC 70190 TaxID=3392118 RepID=UPI00398F8033